MRSVVGVWKGHIPANEMGENEVSVWLEIKSKRSLRRCRGLVYSPSFSPAVVIFLSVASSFGAEGVFPICSAKWKGPQPHFLPPPLKCAPPKLALVFVRERVKSGKREAERSWVLNLAAACVCGSSAACGMGGWWGKRASFSLPGDAHFLSLSLPLSTSTDGTERWGRNEGERRVERKRE